MSASLLATRAELDGITSIGSARQWIGLDEDAWSALDSSLGTCPNLRVLALIPAATLQASIESTRVFSADASGGPRPLTVVEGTQARLMWRVARQKFNLPDEDPLDAAPSPAAPEEPPPAAAAAPPPPPRAPAGPAQPLGPPGPPAPRPAEVPGFSKEPRKPGEYGHVVTQPMGEGRYQPAEDPSVVRVQQMSAEAFYHIHRTRGLHLGPRYRAVDTAWACPGACLAVLHPRRPGRKDNHPAALAYKGGEEKDRWWKQYLPGSEAPVIPKPREPPTYGATQEDSTGGKHAGLPDQSWWPAKEGRGLGILKELHEPFLCQAPGEAARLVKPGSLVHGAQVHAPPKRRTQTGTFHPATLEEDDNDDGDEPWTYQPGLYDSILTCTFLAANPVPGATPAQLPLPFRVDAIRLKPHVKASAAYFGRAHPTDENGVTHYFEIMSPGDVAMQFTGFEARAARALPDSKPAARAQTGETTGGGAYLYRTGAPSPGRSLAQPPSTRPGRSSRAHAHQRPTAQKQKAGGQTLSQAEKDEVRKRVAKWSAYVPGSEDP